MAGSQSTVARSTFHLPLEVTTEILLRLPVKSLLRFKSVCKTWYDLIKTPDFISKHLQTHSALNSISLLVTTYNYKTGNHALSLICNDGFNTVPINLDFPFLNWTNTRRWYGRDKKYFSIVGICNGLVCISLSRFGWPLILCNPSTRQFREIPNSEWKLSDENGIGFVYVKWVSFGFGFHPRANDYKLIRIVLYSNPVNEAHIRADLYSMRTDTWREIDVDKVSVFVGEMNDLVGFGSFMQIPGSCASAVLNGVSYGPARLIPSNEVIVMSFDMDDEVFRKIRTPVCLDETWNETNCQITELKDKLALVVHHGGRCFDVWVLNEDQSSWTNQFKVGSFPRIDRYGENGVTEVVGCTENGELLVTNHEVSGDLKLFSYDPKTWESTDLYFSRVSYPSYIYLYTGTLIPVMETNGVVLNKNQKRKY